MNIKQLVDDLTRHEGLRLQVYDDATGKPISKGDTLKGFPTIGIGRNLAGRGITEKEAKDLLYNDIDYFYKKLRKHHTFNCLNDARKNVILNMAFNLGYNGIMKFKKMWSALENKDYIEAGYQMIDSKWAKDVGSRADELALKMRTGE